MGQKVNPLGFRLGVSQKHISHWFIENNNYSQLVVEDQFIRNFFYKRFPGIASINIKRDVNRIRIEIFSSNTRDLSMEGGKITAKATLLPSQAGTPGTKGTSLPTSQSTTNSGGYQVDSVCDQLLKELTAYRNTRSKKRLKDKKLSKSNQVENNGAPSTSSSASNSQTDHLTKEQAESGASEKPVEVELFLTKVENPNRSAACLAEFIVEQLEKRVPFRRVLKRSIQKAEEGLVEGVKVQISGRLNGAEIARSERIHKGQVPLHTLRAKIEYNSRTAKTIYGLLGVKVWVFNGFADVSEAKLLNKS